MEITKYTQEYELAQKCYDHNKTPKYIKDFDTNSLEIIHQEGDLPGLKIKFTGIVQDIQTGRFSVNEITIPNVQDFSYTNGELRVESSNSLYSNHDFSKEYKEIYEESERKLAEEKKQFRLSIDPRAEDTRPKSVYILNSFVDFSSIQTGQDFKFMDDDGIFRTVGPILNATIQNGHVCVETKRALYSTFDPYREKIEDLQPRENPTIQKALVEKCFSWGGYNKTPQLFIGVDLNNIRTMDADENWYIIKPEDIKPGMKIAIQCSCQNMETGEINTINNKAPSGKTLCIPHVVDCAFIDNQLVIETRSSLFSSVDFSKEYNQTKSERAQRFNEINGIELEHGDR